MELLLDAGAQVESVDSDGATALSVAAFFGHSNAVDALLRR